MQTKVLCIGKTDAGNGEIQISLQPVMGQETILMSPNAPFTEIQLRTSDEALAAGFKVRGQYALTVGVEEILPED